MDVRKGLLLLLACGVVAACSSPDEKLLASAERHVAAQMKDPDSAKFSGQFIVRQPVVDQFQAVSVCGLVNGKNSFGAYTGPRRFVATYSISDELNIVSNPYVEFDDGSTESAKACKAAGKQATIFEEVYWNAKCVDELHPPIYTGVALDRYGECDTDVAIDASK